MKRGGYTGGTHPVRVGRGGKGKLSGCDSAADFTHLIPSTPCTRFTLLASPNQHHSSEN